MQKSIKKRAVRLGVRIGLTFAAAMAMLILAFYHVGSQNVKRLMTDYGMKLARTMADQGANRVDGELRAGLREIRILAEGFTPSAGRDAFSDEALAGEHTLRLLYVTQDATLSSDSRGRDLSGREDVRRAFRGESGIFGPYFNEESEYVVCYSAPVYEGERVAGVLTMEKDGYLFSALIRDVRFSDSGESYLVNEEGTVIAADGETRLDRIESRYSAARLTEGQENLAARAVSGFINEGLRGESGGGSYTSGGQICYAAYAPVKTGGWTLLSSLREEDINARTRGEMDSGLSGGYALKTCFAAFLVLIALMIYWIVSCVRKNARIHENLEKIANLDALTGLFNRRYLETNVENRWRYPIKTPGQAAVFMADIDDFKLYNDAFGHQKGDDCLRLVAGVFKDALNGYDSYVMRYGGEEFIAVVFGMERAAARRKAAEICRRVEKEKQTAPRGGCVTVSVGVCHIDLTADTPLSECIQYADRAMYTAKRNGKNQAAVYDQTARP